MLRPRVGAAVAKIQERARCSQMSPAIQQRRQHNCINSAARRQLNARTLTQSRLLPPLPPTHPPTRPPLLQDLEGLRQELRQKVLAQRSRVCLLLDEVGALGGCAVCGWALLLPKPGSGGLLAANPGASGQHNSLPSQPSTRPPSRPPPVPLQAIEEQYEPPLRFTNPLAQLREPQMWLAGCLAGCLAAGKGYAAWPVLAPLSLALRHIRGWGSVLALSQAVRSRLAP